MTLSRMRAASAASFAILLLALPVDAARAQTLPTPAETYADLADLADSANIVVHAQVRSLARLKPEQAPGVRPGQARFYLKAKTRSLLLGKDSVGESLAWLVDLPLDDRGKPPAIKKRDVIVFARAVPGRPGELQLVGRDSQIAFSESVLTRLRPILTELAEPYAPPRITGVREVIHVPGNLAGTGETQIFLSTGDGSAASVTVRHLPGRQPAWGVSFSELVAEIGREPARDTLAWYRLACFLPNALRPGINLSASAMDRQQAISDYRMVLGQLGSCVRNRS